MQKRNISVLGRFVAVVMAVCCFVFVWGMPHANAETVYQLGDEGAAIREIQKDLITMGYQITFKLTDGVYDKNMENAVYRFQQHYNIEKTGKVDKLTRTRLRDRAAAVRKAHNTEGIPSLFDDCYQLIEEGSRDKCVRTLQSSLQKLGYNITTVDGRYSRATVKAVEQFQVDHNLFVDGKAGSSTLVEIERCIAKLKPEEVVAVKPVASEVQETGGIQRVLRYGDSGEDVKLLQQRLQQLGYDPGSINGKLRSGTLNALKAFQKKNGLDPDGICGAQTVQLLFSGAAVTVDGTTAIVIERTLKYKDTGDDVKALQARLIELGYMTGNVSGNYRSSTKNAVKTFQKKIGLHADGVCGPATVAALFAADAPRAK